MNVFILKITALISMIIDHYGAIFHKGVDIYRIIGRLAFLIYNGELGPKNKYLQILFYTSYPLHLIAYYIVKQ